MPYLSCRNGTYYFRVRIPSDLKHAFNSREIVRSLKTPSRGLAKKQSRLLTIALLDIFDDIREGILRRDEIRSRLDQVFHQIMETQCKYIDRYGPKSGRRIEFLAALSQDFQTAADKFREHDPLGALRSLHDGQDGRYAALRFQRAKKRLGELPEASDRKASMIDAEVAEMLSAFYREAAQLHEDSKQYVYRPDQLVVDDAGTDSITVSEALERYGREKHRAGNWTVKTSGEVSASINQLLEVCGDVAVSSLARTDAVRFKDVLSALPPNINKIRDKRFANLTLEEIADLEHPELVKPQTVNKTLRRVRTLLDWCKRNGYCTDNPFNDVKVEEARAKAADARDAFEPDEIRQIIDRATEEEDGWKKWVPLIGVYSGMRLNESCQLYRDDILEEDGIWCFRITDRREDQKLKTINAARLVPVHKVLIDLGLLDYASGEGDSRLFPDLKLTKNGYGDAVSKWFNRAFKKKLDLQPGNKTFHSLRHSFITALKRADVSEAITNAIVGHAQQSLAYGRYGKGYELKALKEVMESATSEK